MDAESLIRLLRDAYLEREHELQEKWSRSLPFGDAMFDRWERARRLGFAEGASIYNSALVFGAVAVGEKTWIGPSCLLDGSGGGLSIGVWCSISAGVQIYTHDTVHWSLSGGAIPRRTGAVSIGDYCYIGSQSIVAAGVSIGSRCVVAANSFVRADVPDRTVVAGSPAVPIGRVEGEGEDVRLVMAGNAER